jgi:hypothetical protein
MEQGPIKEEKLGGRGQQLLEDKSDRARTSARGRQGLVARAGSRVAGSRNATQAAEPFEAREQPPHFVRRWSNTTQQRRRRPLRENRRATRENHHASSLRLDFLDAQATSDFESLDNRRRSVCSHGKWRRTKEATEVDTEGRRGEVVRVECRTQVQHGKRGEVPNEIKSSIELHLLSHHPLSPDLPAKTNLINTRTMAPQALAQISGQIKVKPKKH